VDDRERNSNPDPAEEVVNQPQPPEDSVPGTPSIVDGEEHHVDPRSVKVARIIGVPFTLLIGMVPLVFITIGWAMGGIPTPVYLPLLGGLLLLLTLVVLLTYKLPAVRHKRLRYLVDVGGLRIRRGIFWRKVIWIPISRVQHTDVSQGPVQRSFELATLTVHTAGTAGASISLEGLEHGIAKRLADHLRPDQATHAS
jgi:membrane protein YdbS with pleckstrin-like domain